MVAGYCLNLRPVEAVGIRLSPAAGPSDHRHFELNAEYVCKR